MGRGQLRGLFVLNAAEFSERMAEQMGGENYGDRQYVPHVLRYYVFGRIQTGAGSGEMVQTALTQKGNSGELYWSWYGFDEEVEWFSARGRFEDGSFVPVMGDIIFFDWEGDGGADHVGIVESVESGRVHTIEGNSGNAVKRRSYSLGDGRIYGYGVLILMNCVIIK